MICQYCKSEISDKALFCTKCGKKVEKIITEKAKLEPNKMIFCAGCGSQLKVEGKFCTKCGKKIEAVTVSEPVKAKIEENAVSEEQITDSEPERMNESEIELNAELKKEEKVAEKQEKLQAQSEGKKFCRKCGTPLKPGAKFCAKCGNSVNAVEAADVSEGSDNKTVREKEKESDRTLGQSKIILIIIIGVVALAAIVGIGCMLLFSSPKEDFKEQEEQIVETENGTMEAASEEALTENPLVGVDFNLNVESRLSLTGFVQESESGWLLQLDGAKSFGGQKTDGEPIRLDNVTSVAVLETELPENMLSDIKSDEQVTMTGWVEITDDAVQITPTDITDEAGDDRIALFEDKGGDRLEQDYIISYSDTYLLTEEDVEDLTVQEINYAKNEIYARHGRKFASNELQNYFNSKDWYYGTIEPEDFDGGHYLSDIENKNAAFLSEVEKKMGVYQLDK